MYQETELKMAMSEACEGLCEAVEAETCRIQVETNDVDEAPQCWICLSTEIGESELEQPCKCPRFAHRTCLANWQIRCAGKSEEQRCRFCEEELPDWRAALEEKPRAAPIMTVTHNGEHHVLRVTPGEDGRQDFEDQIREIYGLGPEDNISVTFGIKEPWSGADVQLEGWGAWRAAVECAACSAGSRPSQMSEQTERMSGSQSRGSWWKSVFLGCLQTFWEFYEDDDMY